MIRDTSMVAGGRLLPQPAQLAIAESRPVPSRPPPVPVLAAGGVFGRRRLIAAGALERYPPLD
jgi:hypothetical protein